MKIEVCESLACSYLRHVKRCWIVQTNWKASEHWELREDAELEKIFSDMKCRFDHDGIVFKRTKDAAQALKQAEIDVVGVDQQGDVHAIEVAFHEAGLNYSGKDDRVLKKMLRTLLVLRTLTTRTGRLCIYFLSPKVHPASQQLLDTMFADLRTEYTDIEWRLLTNEHFAECIVKPTLNKARGVPDLSELFMRSVKLLETSGYRIAPPASAVSSNPSSPHPKVVFQDLVRALMWTLLVDPSLLSDVEKRRLMDKEYCSKDLGLEIGNHELIRKIETGIKVGRHPRYWKDCYGDFYVCKEWPKNAHCGNAESLLVFVKDLICRKGEHKETLRPHCKAFCNYLSRNCSDPGGKGRS